MPGEGVQACVNKQGTPPSCDPFITPPAAFNHRSTYCNRPSVSAQGQHLSSITRRRHHDGEVHRCHGHGASRAPLPEAAGHLDSEWGADLSGGGPQAHPAQTPPACPTSDTAALTRLRPAGWAPTCPAPCPASHQLKQPFQAPPAPGGTRMSAERCGAGARSWGHRQQARPQPPGSPEDTATGSRHGARRGDTD